VAHPASDPAPTPDEGPPRQPASVYLIGAGPGDPGLLTLRGAELLARSDVVLYDGLSNRALLQHAPQAEKISVGKHGQSRIWTQQEIIEEMLRHVRAGKTVARLKGGDPAVFARTADETEALRDAGVAFEIVPGITAALAAGSYAGIPITHRRYASAVALVTGQEEPGKAAPTLDWDALARFPGTLVVYMGVTTAAQWTASLLAAGKPPETPAAILRRCSLPDQQRFHCRLDEVAERLSQRGDDRIRPPVIVILGEVTRLADSLAWFDRRPLFGQRILVTRPQQQAAALADPLRQLGAEVLLQPAIEIAPPTEWEEVDRAIAELGSGDTLVFNSRNGVTFFMDRFLQRGRDARSLAGISLAAVGTKTAEALAAYRLRADVVPEAFHAEALLDALQTRHPEPPAGGRFVILRASRGRDVLAPALRKAGHPVQQLVVYQNRDVRQVDPQVAQRLEEGQIDWVTVTSSAIAESLIAMFGDRLQHTQLVSISTITYETLRRHGFRVAAEADPHSMAGVVQAMERSLTGPRPF
jgi:uroporphyrinogen III methyltransferase/synthase